MLIYEVLNNAAKKLLPILKDKRSARTGAETLLLHSLNISRERLYIILRDEMPEKQQRKFEKLVACRAGGEPLQYILGYWWFYGRKFFAKKGVLIPRQDTEAVIDAVKSLELPGGTNAADVGSGTGIIGATLKLEVPAISRMTCIDNNPKAVSLTRLNSRENNASIHTVQDDFFAFAALKKPRFNLIASNPPYVKISALKGLQREVKREPRSALAAKRQGMDFYIKFAEKGADYLLPGGYLVLEIGDGMGRAVRKVFKRTQWRFVSGFRDFRGRVRAMVFKFLAGS